VDLQASLPLEFLNHSSLFSSAGFIPAIPAGPYSKGSAGIKECTAGQLLLPSQAFL